MEKPNTPVDESASALEQFRQQWREEVTARSKQGEKKPIKRQPARRLTAESGSRPDRPINKPPGRHPLADIKHEDDDDEIDSPTSGMIERIEGLRVKDVDEDDFSGTSTKEPKSALEHYERAVEKESQGNLGESLAHYRKAYRLDDKVDQTYKNKHFPAKSKPDNPNPSNAAVTVPNPAHHSSEPDNKLTLAEIAASWAELEIPNAEPLIQGDIPPPCPIRKLPSEVLIDVLEHIAIKDPAIYARLSLVCRRFAYHVFHESTIWKRVALGWEFGFASQQYTFATDVQGREAIFQALEEEKGEGEEDAKKQTPLPPVNENLFPKPTDWREVFHSHPRIRFSGVYISTVNYTRAGGVSATPGTWNTSVHIVTYYRYLRFFRDGTVISLLTTNEPVEVVHHLTKENVRFIRSNGKDSAHPLNFTASAPALLSKDGQSLPPTAQNLLKHALRGRWRICHPSLTNTSPGAAIGANTGAAGDLHIETEGVGPRYTYTLHLSIKSGAKSKQAVKNNKLVWKGFWSYNNLTDDWSEFLLKNDKPFWFSRVKSYGLGY